MKSFESFLVIGHNGVDVEATCARFRESLQTAVDTELDAYVQVMGLVDRFLEENKSVNCNLDFITGSVAREMGATATNYTTIKSNAAKYIRSHACGEKDGKPIDLETGDVLSAPKQYFLGKGRGGGVSFWSDRIARKA